MRTWKLLLLSLVVGCSAGSVQNGHDPGADAGQSGGGGDDGGTGPMTPGDDGGTLPPAPLEPSIQICNGQTPPLGLGSFARALPPGAKGPQATIYKTARVTGAMPTNHWWSSVAWEPYSEAMFPHPFAVQATAAGLAVDAPRPSAADKGIFAGFAADFTLGSTASASFPDARVDGFSDWAVSMLWSAGAGSLRVTTGSGLPFLYAEFKGGTPTLTFTSAPTVFAGDANASVLGVTIAGHSYGLFAPSGAKWTGLGTATIGTDLAGKDYLSIAALPDASPATLQAFAQYAYSFVTDTRADWAYDEASARVQTTFTVTTVAKEGAQRGTIFALYPHQWKNSGATLLAYQYPTVRGLMKTVAGSSFSTNLTFHGVLPMLPKEPGNLSAADYGQLIRSSLEPANPPAADTYWTGKELGRLATLAPIAELANETATAETARGRLEKTLSDYFTAPAGKTDHLFYYDSNWGTLIGYPASYGSDEHLNDHHFHYGYWIRAAAEIARRDAAWAQPASWGTLVQLVIQDIANWDRTNPCFPYLRNFDVYEGHSWASGDGRFADGNNNESSSEGMNAWASLILWGEATGNRTIRDLGVYLYATEASSIEQYWFDVDGDNFMNAYQHNYASMIWGAKTVYETWFSADPQMVRGINMLPLTSTSLYLGYRPNTVSGNIAQLVTEFGSNKWTTWQDVLWGYQALADANGAVALYQANLGYAPEAGETRAHTYSMLYSLKALGQVDTSVTADTALYNVFKNGATITHVAYNAGSAPRQVRFSDGTVLTVPAGALASQ